jgi:hypothetical protein
VLHHAAGLIAQKTIIRRIFTRFALIGAITGLPLRTPASQARLHERSARMTDALTLSAKDAKPCAFR